MDNDVEMQREAPVAWGNDDKMMMLWAITGSVVASIAVLFHTSFDVFPFLPSVVTLTCVAIVYSVGHALKGTPLFRKRRGWIVTIFLNFLASIITISVGLEHNKDEKAIITMMMVAFCVFSWMEVSKPIFDFGVGQYFLRLPLQMAIDFQRKHFTGLQCGAGAMLVVGTIWQSYHMKAFQERINRIEEAKKLRESNREEALRKAREDEKDNRIKALEVEKSNIVLEGRESKAVQNERIEQQQELIKKQKDEIIQLEASVAVMNETIKGLLEAKKLKEDMKLLEIERKRLDEEAEQQVARQTAIEEATKLHEARKREIEEALALLEAKESRMKQMELTD